ncbi:MAG: hypothetical protein RR406_00025 [Bacilli bacterium]
MTKEEIQIEICKTIAKLSEQIMQADKNGNYSVMFTMIGIRAELMEIIMK